MTPTRIWLITTGETLPCDGPNARLYRTGMVANYLSANGIDVVWWSSNFNHHTKKHRFEADTTIRLNANLSLILLRGRGYKNHVSLQRIFDHRDVARDFLLKAHGMPTPQAVVAAYPTIEMADTCVRFARQRGIPIALDIRDLWPDIMEDIAPRGLRWLAHALLSPYRAKAQNALRSATAIFGVTQPYLNWGLRMAGRKANEIDRVIPFSYPTRVLPGQDSGREYLSRLGLPDNATIVCFFAVFGRQLDIPTIIAAARMLEARNTDNVYFVLCGEGDTLQRYREMADGAKRVLFPGWIDQTQISALMSVSIAGLAPYIPNCNFRGHIPNKPVEYLSAGLPIITCLDGLLNQISPDEDIGVTYRYGAPESLVSAIDKIRSSPNLQRMRDCAKRIFSESYASEVVMKRHLDSILTLASIKDTQLT
jgi:glycosyltransferase involved in cell wall biosynthesis